MVISKVPLYENSLGRITTQLLNVIHPNTDYCQGAHLIQKKKNQHSIA